MSTSELRRGPGWWMNLEGQWNPPEEWPESSPPLPGWIRDADGMWTEPPEVQEGPHDGARTAAEETYGDVHTAGAPARLTIRPIPDITPAAIPPLDSLTTPAVFGRELDVEHPPHHQAGGSPKEDKAGLSFSETTADLYKPDNDRDRLRALTAAILAAITASMFAGGLVLLLLLL